MKATPPVYPHIYPLGDAALVVDFGNSISPEVHRQILALSEMLEKTPLVGVREWVPAYSSLCLYYDPWQLFTENKKDPYQSMLNQLLPLLQQLPQLPSTATRLLEIPVCYGGNLGPDLDEVAQHTGLTPAEIIRLHSQARYTVYMIGFAPGFPYLGGLDKRLATPRKKRPRTHIPAGSVGIAGEQTGLYPIETPGGWQLIGRSPLQLFDLHREKPSLLQMGDTVQFIPIAEEEFWQQKKKWHGN